MGKLIAGAVLAVAALAVTTTPVAAAPSAPTGLTAPRQEGGDGLRAQTSTTYSVDPAAGVIHGSSEVTLTNQMSGGWYFYAYSVPVLREAVNPRVVRSDGQSLSVSMVPDDDPTAWFAYMDVRLRPNLFPGNTITFRLDYEVPFQAPRAAGWSRGNAAVVTFPAVTSGDPNLGRIEVRVPDDYDVEVGGAQMDRTTEGGQIVLKAEAIADPYAFTPVIAATKDDKLLSRKAKVEGRDITLRAWPNDAGWVDYMSKELSATMPVLQELVGQPWPDNLDGLAVVESPTPAAHGYGGWYDPQGNAITLGDAFDPQLIAHELSHVWFNEGLFPTRWINEGLADEFAQTTLERRHVKADPAVEPNRSGPGAVALNAWDDPASFTDVDHVTEEYGYAAAWYVLDQVDAEVGPEKLREVVAAAAKHQIAYAGDPQRETMVGRPAWQVLLDLLENEAGSTKATQLFDRFVVTDDERGLLGRRAKARQSYLAQVERGDGWTPPYVLRKAMAEWDFAEVTGDIAQADEVLEVRADIERALEGLDVDHLGLEGRYERATRLDRLANEAEDTLAAARDYRHAHQRYDDTSGSLLGRIGLLGTNASAKLDEARDGIEQALPRGSSDASATVERRLDAAVRNALLRLGAVALLVGLLGWRLLHRLGRRRVARQEVKRLEAMFAAPDAADVSDTEPEVAP